MSDLDGLTIRHRRLAAELRRLRGRSGMTGDQVAENLNWSASKVSRLEHGRTGFKMTDVVALLDLYEVPTTLRDDLLALTRTTYKKSWLESESASLPTMFAAYVSTETEAETIWNWEPQIVPGLLQTENYARSIHEAWQTVVTLSPAEIQRRVAIRLERQNLLDRDPPLYLFAVLDESVLTRRIGSASIMREQLDHLLESTERDTIDVRVLPLHAFHPISTGSFVYMQFPSTEDVSFNDVVATESLTSNYYVEGQDDTYQYRLTFERLVEESLDDRKSAELISKYARELWAPQ
ncbi:MAG TPA: helix-turn-helix transcriptional regulator [Streptosporangiaceae bacterium]|nr:helix-turn-helix transcriptional regulator [Streptosporangiaceae bacterium]